MGRVSTSAGPDPRELPAYHLVEAAHYLNIPVATLSSWTVGRPYPVAGGKKFFHPVIEIADKKRKLLSFINRVEAHVLDAIRRREHRIQLPKIRRTIVYLRREFHAKHPLAGHQLETDGLDPFVQKVRTADHYLAGAPARHFSWRPWRSGSYLIYRCS
jgi:hypothetical protein